MSDTQVIFDMAFEDYLKVPALSSTAIKKITISIDDYLNPDPEKETKSKSTGKAYHKALLEGLDAFEAEYCRQISKDGYVCTVPDAKEILLEGGFTGFKKSGDKAYFMDLCRERDIPVYDDVIANETREILKADDYDRIVRCAKELHATIDLPPMRNEVSVFWTDNDVPMKARFDGVNEWGINDLKTYNNTLGRNLDKLPAQIIANYRYDIQAVLYVEAYLAASKIMPELFKASDPFFDILWVQQKEGFNFRGTRLTPNSEAHHTTNSYWNKACTDIATAKELYDKHVTKKQPLKRIFGFEPLEDADLPMYHWDKNDIFLEADVEISASE